MDKHTRGYELLELIDEEIPWPALEISSQEPSEYRGGEIHIFDFNLYVTLENSGCP